jgi:hypothetical protein
LTSARLNRLLELVSGRERTLGCVDDDDSRDSLGTAKDVHGVVSATAAPGCFPSSSQAEVVNTVPTPRRLKEA